MHHSRKTGGEEINAESARGGSALIDASRETRVLNRMTEAEAKKHGLETHHRFFRVYSDKINVTPSFGKSDWYRHENVNLSNGDKVGVVASWTPPNYVSEIKTGDFEKIYKTLQDKGPFRANEQAEKWCGHIFGEILGIDTGRGVAKRKLSNLENQGRAKIRAFIDSWTKEGQLIEFSKIDKNGRNVPYLKFGE